MLQKLFGTGYIMSGNAALFVEIEETTAGRFQITDQNGFVREADATELRNWCSTNGPTRSGDLRRLRRR